jgi:cytosine/adenosine deaminase-related metal-dependent hydrolase
VIRGGWVVGFGGRTHTLIRAGVVVWEDGRIVHVGPRFEGTADLVIDAPASSSRPASSTRTCTPATGASHRLIADHRTAGLLRPALPRHQRAA